MSFRQITGLDPERVNPIIDAALSEDLGQGDVTTDLLVSPRLVGRAVVLSKAAGVLAGGEVARMVFLRVDPSLDATLLIKDGSQIKAGDIIATVSGSVASILKAERTVLNFLQRMSGIATETARYVARVSGLPVRVVDTRKTTPGLRLLEKYSVRMGGGHNHRFNLGDAVLIKDNHIVALRVAGMSLKEAVSRARQGVPPGTVIEVETTNLDEVRDAIAAGADVIMLDNMPPDMMKEAVRTIAGRAEVEASGRMRLENIRTAAETGVNLISVGALTHSVPSLDISIELEKESVRVG